MPDGGERAAASVDLDALLEPELAPEPAPGAEPAGEPCAGGDTLERLLRRMQRTSDFPVLSETVGSVNRAASADHERADVLCDCILKDFALTNKLLRLVNSASYRTQAEGVSTVSRAVALLGTEGVRNVAMSLQLIEHLQDRDQAGRLRGEIAAACFSGVLARQLARRTGLHNAEEAFVCAMFHRLGRLLAAFYFPQEAGEVERRAGAGEADECTAARDLLGLSYEDLGMGIARHWGFPSRLVHSMRTPALPLPAPCRSEDERLCAVSSLAAGVADALRLPGEAARVEALRRLAAGFGPGLHVDAESMARMVQDSVAVFEREAGHFGVAMGKKEIALAARALGGAPTAAAQPPAASAEDARTLTLDPDALLEAAAADRRAALAAGIQDITNTLIGEYVLNDVLRIILETMYRAVGFARVLMFVSDSARGVLRARLGFGAGARELVERGISVPLEGPRDVFFAAIRNGSDVLIQDIDAENIRRHVPAWYRETVRARAMMLFPISVNKRLVGLIYADSDQPGKLDLRPEELNLLKTLRNQVVLAIRQKG